MKDFLDRQPTKAGRRKLTFDDGEVKYVTVEMGDEPTVDGTPLNREAFMDMQGFSTEDTTISENGNVTTVSVTHSDGGTTVTTITVESETFTRVVSTYTGPTGYVNVKETTIDTSGENVVIGGVAS